MFNSWSIAHRSISWWVLYFPENLIETLEPAVFKIGVSGSTVYGFKDPGCRDH